MMNNGSPRSESQIHIRCEASFEHGSLESMARRYKEEFWHL